MSGPTIEVYRKREPISVCEGSDGVAVKVQMLERDMSHTGDPIIVRLSRHPGVGKKLSLFGWVFEVVA